MNAKTRQELLCSQKVYICAPMRACDDFIVYDNQKRAEQFAIDAMEEYGCQALSPQAYLPYLLDLDDPIQFGLSLQFREKLISFCDAILVCGSTVTDEMQQELLYAIQKGLLIVAKPENETAVHRFITQRGLGWEVIL
ncbi:hypothetical protein [uncultured Subdoligranulum sp.]|uniref:DUF7768 domain-containing protein n=1 Tax=uncultured Subdoligranulum sp. TaxID=512298 RepID=UPI00261BA7AC|nr:hypothetical protein [uncultured Subdoligranulum sp.]